jgi:outer membrane protein assembly factor BamB
MHRSIWLPLVLIMPAILAADWPQFHGPTRDGFAKETKLISTFPNAGPKILWSFEAGAGWAGPVVSSNRAILFHRLEGREVINCLDVNSGKNLWSNGYRATYRDDFGFDEGPRATPLVEDGRIFTLGADADLVAWDLKSGKILWQKNLPKTYSIKKPFFGYGSSPIMVDGTLILNVGSTDASIVGFDPATGAEKWKAGSDAVSYSSPIQATIQKEQVVIFFTREGLLIVSPKEGKVRSQFPWRPRMNASVNAASPILSGNELFLSTSYSQGAILLDMKKLDEPSKIWSNDTSISCQYNTPLLLDGNLYGIHGRQDFGDAGLRCVDWKTGAIKWRVDTFGTASLIHADGRFYAMTEPGELVIFEVNATKYVELARASILSKGSVSAPALADGKYLARDKQKWICVSLNKL